MYFIELSHYHTVLLTVSQYSSIFAYSIDMQHKVSPFLQKHVISSCRSSCTHSLDDIQAAQVFHEDGKWNLLVCGDYLLMQITFNF